jgi:alanine-glyoxylate transaminase/serine-glyoxylate transaminase/serine-pyruvate transaminase
MNRAIIDHRGPEFSTMVIRLLEDLRWIFGAPEHVFVFPSSASGCWEAALVNTLSPGDQVLVFDNGFFAGKWGAIAERIGFNAETLEGDWRYPVDARAIRNRLRADQDHSIQAVLVVHNETSTGVTSNISEVRAALDTVEHPALLMVDAGSSLGATDFQQGEWRVDVTVSGSQKGLMLPPGLGFCAVSSKAMEWHERATSPRGYWDFTEMLDVNGFGFFPYTPATTLLYGLEEALVMLREEGLDMVFARHAHLAEATRLAVSGWGLDNFCAEPIAYSNSGTTVQMPDHFDADAFRGVVLKRFNMSLGSGLGRLKGEVFRIGHLGDLNELMLMGALAGVEMGLKVEGISHERGGLSAAMEFLAAL